MKIRYPPFLLLCFLHLPLFTGAPGTAAGWIHSLQIERRRVFFLALLFFLHEAGGKSQTDGEVQHLMVFVGGDSPVDLRKFTASEKGVYWLRRLRKKRPSGRDSFIHWRSFFESSFWPGSTMWRMITPFFIRVQPSSSASAGAPVWRIMAEMAREAKEK